MFFAAALMIWACDPIHQPPEARLPVGAIARIGNSQMTRPFRYQENLAISHDNAYLIFYQSYGTNSGPLEFWDLNQLKRIPPPYRLPTNDHVMGINSQGLHTSSSDAHTLRDEKTGVIRFQIPLEDDDYHLLPQGRTRLCDDVNQWHRLLPAQFRWILYGNDHQRCRRRQSFIVRFEWVRRRLGGRTGSQAA
jgi:hypothetical protein